MRTKPARRPPVRLVATAILVLLSACVDVPEGVEVVDGFEVERYVGQWYEIARLDHRFERDLINVTATYTLRDDGSVGVVNQGYSTRREEWQSVEGRALFVAERDRAEIKVSFFGPFFGGYNVIALDHEDYAYAMVCGPNRDYLWILAREPELSATITDALVAQAGELGFAVDTLIWVPHTEDPPDAGAVSPSPAQIMDERGLVAERITP